MATPFGTFSWLRFSGQSGTCCPREPQFGFFPLVFEVPTSTMVTHYESLQESAFDGTPLWGIFLASVEWLIRHLLSKVAAIWFFSLVCEVPMSTMVTHCESQQGGAVDGTPLGGIFLASVQWPFRHLLSKVAAIWFFSSRF
jgi:hypothetical protein